MKKINAATENFVPVQVITRGAMGNRWNEKAVAAFPTKKANGNEVIKKGSQKDLAKVLLVHESTVSYCLKNDKLCKGYRLVSIDSDVGEAFNALMRHYNATKQEEAMREVERSAQISELEAKAAQWDAYQAQLRAEAEAKRKAEEERQRAIEARNKKIAELEHSIEVRKQLAAQYAEKLARAQSLVSEAETELAALREQEV